ncbi:diacylglycerol/lipid kinase family protein [Streptomyces hydrogenans]|uniref:diacylglycerol/lipid kinase family protein n=1 Tax=Streptomyces hydrogenans TaxID=1873719 RepID=UPI0035D6EF9B
MGATLETGADAPGDARLLARLALLAVLGSLLVLVLALGEGGLLVLGAGILGVVLCAAGVWWFVAHRGVPRVIGALLVFLAPAGVVVLFAYKGLWLTALILVLCWGIALTCARAALRRSRPERPQVATPAGRPARPVLIMNPKSGGGKVGRFGLVERAEELGARVILLDPDAPADVAELARRAVADGADLLGVAGGDGTQALVAAVAAEHDLPFLVISAGTRNHLAMDLGLDRNDPSRCLDALTDGEELRIDLGDVSGRAFVNTVSFGVYADVVQRPEYRDDKAGTALNLMPDLLVGDGVRRLDSLVDGAPLADQQALLVSNNPYFSPDEISGTGRRPRLDDGELGVLGIRVEDAAQAADLAVRGSQSSGLTVLSAHRVEVTVSGPAETDGTPEQTENPGTEGSAEGQGTSGAEGAAEGQGISETEGSAEGQGNSGTEGSADVQGTAETEGSTEAQETSRTERSTQEQVTSRTEGSTEEQGTSRTEGAAEEQGTSGAVRSAQEAETSGPVEIPVAVDGEALRLPTPVVCTLRPGALRVLVPRDRPGVVAPPPAVDWRRILDLAFGRTVRTTPR